ncbi:MAG: hypothetical protein K6C08_01705, partial [Oscillospiraceae bacterium]|nr:hypothetical protein [Oscillospiraceae bacterium]
MKKTVRLLSMLLALALAVTVTVCGADSQAFAGGIRTTQQSREAPDLKLLGSSTVVDNRKPKPAAAEFSD